MSDFGADWRTWRAEREKRLRDPRGWLSITAIHWLDETPQRFVDVPGAWSCGPDGAVVVLDAGETLTTDVELGEGRHELGPVDEHGLTVSFGNAVAELALRVGDTILRPRSPDSANLRGYRGTPCYPPDPRWVLRGRFEPYPEPVARETQDEEEVGEVVFSYAGSEHRLVAWGDDEGLWILFRDATSGVTTYPANRQLFTDLPGPDGGVSVDFNRALNMPCAYTDFAVCPVAPAANTLPFAVEAGEQLPVMTAS